MSDQCKEEGCAEPAYRPWDAERCKAHALANTEARALVYLDVTDNLKKRLELEVPFYFSDRKVGLTDYGDQWHHIWIAFTLTEGGSYSETSHQFVQVELSKRAATTLYEELRNSLAQWEAHIKEREEKRKTITKEIALSTAFKDYQTIVANIEREYKAPLGG